LEAVTRHIKASAENPDVDDTILEEFAEARHARALEIISYTKKLVYFSAFAYDAYAWWMPFSQASVRDLLLRILGRFEFVQSKMAWGLGRR
jgi:2-polyprenyl-6-methoxyphenol hydroxylase-like FAD-dependent oxidoreductase